MGLVFWLLLLLLVLNGMSDIHYFSPSLVEGSYFSYVLQLPMLVSGIVRQGCAGRAAVYKSKQRSGRQNNNHRGR
jgi:hypothetical protein